MNGDLYLVYILIYVISILVSYLSQRRLLRKGYIVNDDLTAIYLIVIMLTPAFNIFISFTQTIYYYESKKIEKKNVEKLFLLRKGVRDFDE